MKKIKAVALCSLLAVAISGPALAQSQDAGFYVGAAFGQSKVLDFCEGVPGGIACEDTDTAFKLLFGYQINRNFAAEFAYVDFGESSISAGGAFARITSTGFELVGIGSIPVAEQFSLYAKLGVYRADSEGRSNVIAGVDDSNTGMTFGFGGRFDVTPQFGIRLEWQRYADVGGDNIGEADVDVISIGATYRF
jgi:OmpA-OmpF porin, OOP family